VRTVADAMAEASVIVEPATTIQQTSAAMLDAGVHAAVVVDRGKVCGVVTADDISRALADGYDATETLVGAIAESDPLLARPDEPLAEAHQRMRARGRPVAAVAGRHGEPLGLLEDREAG
jgi:CBS domain-containing protein